jgi:peptide-methionine (S)-S-oxide reductase
MTRMGMMALALAMLALVPAALAQTQPGAQTRTAVFAGGCFWCVEDAFDQVPGVVETISGYTGGTLANPTYHQVSAGGTGHQEAVEVRYDPSKVTYETLLDTYWHNVDPLDAGGQFCDRGDSYRSVIFVANEEQKTLAQASKQQVAAQLNKKIETRIEPLTKFYPAEGYHQNYHQTNPIKYKFYKWNCGRAQRLQQIWGPPRS